MPSIEFNEDQRQAIYSVIQQRRDMRHFCKNSQVDPDVLKRILMAAHQAPSVGLMQPWRFIRIQSAKIRQEVIHLVEEERQKTAALMDHRQAEFLQLKISGIEDCAELIAVVLAPDDGTVLGRRTMPQTMALCSASCAIQNMWLAARAENLGMGWVSFFQPQDIAELLACPQGSKPIALLCLGPVQQFYDRPMLEQLDWRHPENFEKVYAEDQYPV
ncbi:MAG: 5,6-dimethylbenzimidazole synthase [Mariprofundaceae bacterium]|nr:5,6-dimethylbenzimidazole synthase [Mariprofundaceae bacterium]